MKVYYASHDGQTAKIAHYLADCLYGGGMDADAINIAKRFPTEKEIASHAPCIVIAPVRYGFPLPVAIKLTKLLAPHTPRKPVFLYCVNLTARKIGKRSATTNSYLRKWIERTGIQPVQAEAIAGKLDYPSYKWYDRLMIRLIMKITGGPTNPLAIVDYTPWDRIEVLAKEIAATLAAPQQNKQKVA